MKMTWKKPWTIIAWILSRDEFETEEGPGPSRASRFGTGGFRGWLFSSEADRFREDPPAAVSPSRFREGGFFRWLFAGEKFEEEPPSPVHDPRFGGKTFFRWLLFPEGGSSAGKGMPVEGSPEEGSEKGEKENPRGD